MSKIDDACLMQGICTQWFFDNYENDSSFAVFFSILNYTFRYRKRYAYIETNKFNLSPKTLKKYRDKLTKDGVIRCKKTNSYTMYEILEPKDEIANFSFIGGSQNESGSTEEPSASGSSGGIL